MVEELKELIVPAFNENIVIDILRKATNSKQAIINKIIVADSNSTKGYSYLSSVIKFQVEGTIRDGQNTERKVNVAVIVKTLPKNIGRRLSFRSTDFFRNETVFYNKVWATFQKFQDSKKIKNKFDNIPLCLAAVADGKNDFIALEDLSVKNYVHFKKEKELSYESVTFIITLFARFHALSFAFKDQCPKEFEELVDSIEETYFSENFRKWYSGFHKTLIACSRDAVEKELSKEYIERFNDLINNDLFGRLVKICANRNSKFAVINEGDSWIPNFLVKFDDENNIQDIKLIDFQLARCCSLVCEITFFLYTCASYEMLNTKWDEIIKKYHTEFTSFLKELGSDPNICKMEDLKSELKENVIVGIAMSMEAIPFQVMDDDDSPDLDSIEGDEAIPIETVFKPNLLTKKADRQKLAFIFKHAVDHGFI